MPRPVPIAFFRQSLTSDSFIADELINIYLLRPVAAGIVWILYPTSVTPNQVTAAAIVVGLVAAAVYTVGTPAAIAAAGLLITAKDILDDADGQLARAKGLYSRRGRFLDSIGDFVVDVAVFGAITWAVFRDFPGVSTIALGILSLVGITLRVSYHVYYQVSFLHLEDRYTLNRIVEKITDEDRHGDPVALRLQRVFSVIYTWQDRLMYRIDRWCLGENLTPPEATAWYSDRAALRLSGLLGFGTEYAVLTVCSLGGALHTYLLLNVFLLNAIWLAAVIYRKVLSRTIAASSHMPASGR